MATFSIKVRQKYGLVSHLVKYKNEYYKKQDYIDSFFSLSLSLSLALRNNSSIKTIFPSV